MDGKAEALQFNAKWDAKVLRTHLKDMTLKPGILIAGLVREAKHIIPGGDDMIFPGDKVIVLATNQRLQDLDDILL